MKFVRALLAMTVLALGATQISCSVNDYCLNCGTDDAGTGSNGDANDGGTDDATDAEVCIPQGSEECNGKDDDCNGLVDDGVLPQVGDLCSNQMGECAGGTKICTGGEIKCDKTGTPEICDGKDNNCDGVVDDGDPGGGGKCGEDMGECIAGTRRCGATVGCNSSSSCDPSMPGANCCIVCDGFVDKRTDPEMCNGRDDDCDGGFDEGLTNLGACTWPGATDEGACVIGTLTCEGGAPKCSGAVFPKFELCNGDDDDCDTKVDEVFNKNTDPNNCNACGNVCPTPSKTCAGGTNARMDCTDDSGCPGSTCAVNSQRRCTGGTCGFQCNVGFINLDTQAANGCEYKCSPTGTEECDGIDNDCDGMVDNGLTAPPICLGGGECSIGLATPTTAPTAVCSGAGGWTCNYQGNVQFPETRCDGLNNDCDSNIDENQPNKNQACDDGNVGICRSTGTFQCDTTSEQTRNGPAICAIDSPGQTVGTEACNGIDDDCDGVVDNGGSTGNLVGQEWVNIGGGKQMMKYEASKPDASATSQGTNQTLACSRQDVQPWTNITYPQAVAACASIGATLCSEQTWHRACSVVSSNTYPLNVVSTGTLIEAEDYTLINFATGGTPSATRSWVPDYTAGFSSISGMEAVPNTSTGTVAIADAAAQAPRLAYTLNFTTTASNYHVWVKMWQGAFASTSNTAYVGISTMTTPQTPTATATLPSPTACTSDAQCSALPGTTCIDSDANGSKDTCTGWVWVDADATFNINTTGDRTVSVYMGKDGVKVDQIYVVAGTGTPPQTINSKGNTWAYEMNANTYQPNTCNGDDFDTNTSITGDQDDILKTRSLASCFANVDTGVFDMSGNVKEWTLAHQPGENPIRGGASNNTAVGISCALNFTLGDDSFFFPNVGFRCCRNAP